MMDASDAADTEVALTGGNSTSVSRRGNAVLRECGPWTPAVHRFLDRLEARGLAGVPRVIGLTGDGREELSFLPGSTADEPLPGFVWHPETLRRVAELMRELHDASIDLDRTGPWRSIPRLPDEVICHNDVAPYNTVFDESGTVVGLIDFDFAAPGPRAWDLAYAAYRFAPLTSGATTAPFGARERLDRVDDLLAHYGSDLRSADLLPWVVERLIDIERHSRTAGLQPGREELLEHAELYRRDATYVRDLMGATG